MAKAAKKQTGMTSEELAIRLEQMNKQAIGHDSDEVWR